MQVKTWKGTNKINYNNFDIIFTMIHLPKPPQTQALSSKTFSPPPLDGSLTLPELCDWHLQHSPEHPFFIYPRQDGELQTITWAHAARAILTGARLVRKIMGWRRGMTGTAPVVAMLSASGESH